MPSILLHCKRLNLTYIHICFALIIKAELYDVDPVRMLRLSNLINNIIREAFCIYMSNMTYNHAHRLSMITFSLTYLCSSKILYLGSFVS